MGSINIGNPIIFGLIAGIVTYLILFLDINYENKKTDLTKRLEGKCYCPKLILSLKIPLIVGAIVWAAANYFENIKVVSEDQINMSSFIESLSDFDQELFTDNPGF